MIREPTEADRAVDLGRLHHAASGFLMERVPAATILAVIRRCAAAERQVAELRAAISDVHQSIGEPELSVLPPAARDVLVQMLTAAYRQAGIAPGPRSS